MSNFGGRNEENWRKSSPFVALEDMQGKLVEQSYND